MELRTQSDASRIAGQRLTQLVESGSPRQLPQSLGKCCRESQLGRWATISCCTSAGNPRENDSASPDERNGPPHRIKASSPRHR
jgi:hypothetical protein